MLRPSREIAQVIPGHFWHSVTARARRCRMRKSWFSESQIVATQVRLITEHWVGSLQHRTAAPCPEAPCDPCTSRLIVTRQIFPGIQCRLDREELPSSSAVSTSRAGSPSTTVSRITVTTWLRSQGPARRMGETLERINEEFRRRTEDAGQLAQSGLGAPAVVWSAAQWTGDAPSAGQLSRYGAGEEGGVGHTRTPAHDALNFSTTNFSTHLTDTLACAIRCGSWHRAHTG